MDYKMIALLTISLLFAGCEPNWNIDPIDGGADGSVPDASIPDSGTDGGPTDGGPSDGGWDGGSPCIPTNPCTVPKGICTPNGATYSCSCSAGYHDVSGNCVLDQTCQSNSCGGHGQCSTPSGVVTCVCNVGYEPLYCGTCSTPNWQDKDSNGTCLMACSNPSLVLNCNGHGACSDDAGTAICACNPNWNPASNCNSCVTGYQDNDSNGTCALSCVTGPTGTCNGHGNCLDTSGTATCTCNANWASPNCVACVFGYQDNNGDGTCTPVCASGTCNSRGTCLDTSGTATCTCTGNWDPATSCLRCKSGFGGANCNPIALLTVAPLTIANTTLYAGTFLVARWQITCPGSVSCYVPKQTVSYVFSGGSWTVTGHALYRNGPYDISSTATRSSGRVVINNFAPEDIVAAGSNNTYELAFTIGGSGSTGNTLVTTLIRGTAPASMLMASTGLLYSTSAGVSTLFGSPGGPCSGGSPEFVFVGVPHTAQTLSCAIGDGSGPSDYSTGAEVSSWTAVQFTFTN